MTQPTQKSLRDEFYKKDNGMHKYFSSAKWLDNEKSRKSILELLDEYINTNSLNSDVIYDKIRRYSHYKKPSVLKKDLDDTIIKNLHKKPNHNPNWKRIQRRHNFARILYLSCGIPYTVFGFEEGDLFPKNNTVLTSSNQSVFLDIRDQTGEDFKENYESNIIPHINECSEMKVFDYLGRGHKEIPGIDLNEYFFAHVDIFKCIEDKLIDNQIDYTRILGLHIKDEIPNTFEELGTRIIKQCSPILFHHMCKSLKIAPLNRGVGAKFYITRQPSRTYQFAIFNDSHQVYIYQEQYRFKDKGNAYPSFYTIHPSNDGKDWHLIYNQEIEDHINTNRAMYFTKERINDSLENVIKSFNKKIKEHPEDENKNELMKNIIDEKIKFANQVFDWGIKYLK